MPTDSLFPSSRFSVSERRALLVGRASEMRELERGYALARDKKQTRTVTVVGGTGLGKTRLVRDFLVRSREGGHAPRVYRGSAREGGPAYEVFARVLRARFGIVEGMDAEAAKAQVRAQVAAVLEDRKVGDVAYFLGQLLDLEFQDSPLIRAVEGDAQQLRSMRRAVIKRSSRPTRTRAPSPSSSSSTTFTGRTTTRSICSPTWSRASTGPSSSLCIGRPELLARRDGWRRHGGDRHAVIELSPLGDVEAAAVMHDLLSPCGDAPERRGAGRRGGACSPAATPRCSSRWSASSTTWASSR